MKRVLAILFIILIGFVWAENEGDIQEVTVEGYGAIFQGEKLIGRDAAIKDALRNAVEQVVGTMISSESKVQNYQLISDEIYSKSQGFVEKYEIIEDKPKDSNTYYVKIKALVSKNGIKDKLTALHLILVQQNMPRLVIFLKQNLYGNGWANYYDRTSIAEELLEKEFINKGFVVLDKTQRKANLDRSIAQSAMEGDIKSAQAIATLYGADYFLTGTVVGNVKVNQFYGGFLSAQVDMAIKAIKSDTGQIVASETKHKALGPVSDKITGTNKALELLIPEMVENMTTNLMSKWSSGSSYVHITLKNINYSNYGKFVNFLRERIRMVDKVYKRGFTSGVAEIDLDTKKNAEEIAEELTLRESDLPFKIEIVDVTSSALTLKKVNQ